MEHYNVLSRRNVQTYHPRTLRGRVCVYVDPMGKVIMIVVEVVRTYFTAVISNKIGSSNFSEVRGGLHLW